MNFTFTHALASALLCLYLAVAPIYAKKNSTSSNVRMSAKWYKLNKLINKEEQTIKRITKMGPRLKWRLIELNTERIKLIREKENRIFLSANTKERKRRGKKSYFRESRRIYYKVRKDGLAIIKKWPRFKYNSDIYFTLGLNARDYGGDRETEKFLLLALKSSHKYAKALHSIKTSLAEHYYNKKKYKKAIRYYKQVLKNKEDEWYTKHLYNVAWCYIKVNRYQEAINSALLSFEASKVYLADTPEDRPKIKKYINVKDQLLDSIGFFFVFAERIKEGTEFYIDNVDHPAPYLIKMAKKTANDKGADQAEYVYLVALENAIDKKESDKLYLQEEVEIRIELLDFYRNFKKFNKFWKMAQALDEINKETSIAKINSEYKNEIVEKLRSFVGYLQVRFTRNSKTNIEHFEAPERDRIISFFDILARINPVEKDSYHFYQGETYFAIADYKNSFDYYQKALEAHRKRYLAPKPKVHKIHIHKDKKGKLITPPFIAMPTKGVDKEEIKKHNELTKKIFDALLASLENGKFDKNMNFERTVYTYKSHIAAYPHNKRTEKIYAKLFNLYLGQSKVNEATSTMKDYMLAYPRDRKIQQGMLTQVMDQHIQHKNTDALAIWVGKLQKGFLGFKKDYIEKSILILGGLLFDNYQKLDIAGKKEEAARGYLSLYSSKKYPQSIKAKSAYRASIIYLDIFSTKSSFKWLQQALKLFTAKERFERKKEILAMINKLMLAQDFKSSAAISEDYLRIYCHSPFKEKNEMYQASVQYRLIEGEYERAYKNYERGKKCNVSKKVRNAVLLGMGDFFFRHRKYKSFMSFYERYKAVPHMTNFYHNSFLAMYWDYNLKNSSKGMKFVQDYFVKQFTKTHKTNAQKEMEMVMAFKKLYIKLNHTPVTNLPNPKKYDEKKFNKDLETNIATLKTMTEKLAPYIKSGQIHVITKSYKLLEDKYRELAYALKDYTPRGMPADYVQGLKQAMAGLSKNLEIESKKQNQTALDLINREGILAPDNGLFMKIPPVIKQVKHRHPASLYAIPSDRSGGKI